MGFAQFERHDKWVSSGYLGGQETIARIQTCFCVASGVFDGCKIVSHGPDAEARGQVLFGITENTFVVS